MGDENSEAGVSQPESTAGDAKRLSNDARGLGPMRAGAFAIGQVDEIVGEGGSKVPKFVATKYELLVLVRHSATEIIDLDFTYFLYGCTGSSEWRTRQFANRRLNTIGNLIGKEEVAKAFRGAEQAFGLDGRSTFGLSRQELPIFPQRTGRGPRVSRTRPTSRNVPGQNRGRFPF